MRIGAGAWLVLVVAQAAAQDRPEVRFLNLAPSPYTQRHDAFRVGGAHTGGEVVIADTLRTLMGMGAQVFSMGQKSMVFPTAERFDPRAEGDFTILDCWFMEQFAKNIALVALAGHDRAKAAALEKQLDFTPIYWTRFPKEEATIEPRFRELRDRLNRAADAKSEEYRKLRAMVR